MKLIVTTVLSAVLLFALSACENASEDSSSQVQPQPKTDQSKSISNEKATTNNDTQSTDTGDQESDPSKGTRSDSDSSNSPQSTENGKQSTKNFYGQWTISPIIPLKSTVSSYSNEDLKNLTGKSFTFSKESATCFGDRIESLNHTVKNPVYKKTKLSKTAFQTAYKASLDKLPGIKGDSITEIDVTGENGRCNVFFPTQYKNMLLLFGGGQFFILERPNLTPSDVTAENEPNGTWVKTFEKNLFKGYHVIPSRYKSIGNGNWEVWVREVNTGQNPYVTVNQKTGDFHG